MVYLGIPRAAPISDFTEGERAMRLSNAVGHAFTATVGLAILAGCSGSGSRIGPTALSQIPFSQSVQQQAVQAGPFNNMLALQRSATSGQRGTPPSFFDSAAKGKPLIFASTNGAGTVNIYLQSKGHKMVGQITNPSGGASGLATDSAGNLYVGSPNNSGGNILVYAPPYTGAPQLTLNDSAGGPGAVAVSTAGVVAAANVCGPPNCSTPGSITLYGKASTQPCATIVDPTHFAAFYGVTFDDRGNLYVGGYGSFSSGDVPAVGEIKGGCQAKKVALLSTTTALIASTPLHIDKADRIAIADRYYSNTVIIDAYNPPKHGSFGSPVTSTTLTLSQQNDFAFVASGRDLYFTDTANQRIYKYDYPEGGAAESSIQVSGGQLYGVAVTPPLVP
jgi:sugar lactone lactonase YvrE